jgi:hypothetical protein
LSKFRNTLFVRLFNLEISVMSTRTYLKLSAILFAIMALAGLTIGQVSAQTVSGLSLTTGPTFGGSHVTITGTGFTGATAVDFGAVPAASYSVVNSTTITAVSPPQAQGPVDVTVVNGGTSPANPSDVFTYVGPYVTGVSPTAGSTVGGTGVTIAGSGFTAATKVFFGGVQAATFTIVNDTQITVSSPAQSQAVVNVIVEDGANASPVNAPADQFTYGPSITSISMSTGPTSGGTAVTITGIGFTGATAVDFDSTAAPSFTVVDDTTITTTSPPHAPGVFDISVITPGR